MAGGEDCDAGEDPETDIENSSILLSISRSRRYKREEEQIQAWENHQKRKDEMEIIKTEAKAERLRSRAQEKYTKKLASTRRIAKERRANAEAKLNEMSVKTSERADYIRRIGHLPSTFSFKLPSCFW